MLIIYSLVALSLGTVICVVAGRSRPWLVQAAYAGAVVACLVTAAKLSPITEGVVVSAAIGLYSMTFLLTDYLGEVYGKVTAMRAVWMGIVAEVVMLVAVGFSIAVEPAGFWDGQDAFAATLGSTPRIMLASVSAFVAAQFLDVTVFDWLKRRTKGRFLFLRNNGSTLVSQTADSVVFYTIAFWGVVPNLVELIAVTCLAKYVIAAVDTPFLYAARWMADRGSQAASEVPSDGAISG